MNSFYASVECLYNPSIRDKPVSVCGSVDDRHGIVLASNPNAKRYGIKVGDAIWQAKQKCRNLVVVHPHMDRYVKFSEAARRIYSEYSPCVMPYGLDENLSRIYDKFSYHKSSLVSKEFSHARKRKA